MRPLSSCAFKLSYSCVAFNLLPVLLVSEQREWLFTYYDINNNVVLSFGYNQTGMEMVIDGVVCPVESIISVAEFTSSMKFFCVLWMSSNSRVAAYFNRRYYGKTCSPSSGHSVPAGGVFKLGGKGPLLINLTVSMQ